MDALAKLNEHFLSCSICTEVFKDPCTIGCYHTFCRGCLTKYTKTRRDAIAAESILCPSCCQMTKVPRPQEPVEQWCQQFKPSFLIQGLLDTFTSQEGPSPVSTDHICLTCQQIGKTCKATSICNDCGFILCEGCSEKHRATPTNINHVISQFAGDIKPAVKRQVLCKEHNSQVEYCCRDCQEAICHKCCIFNHRKCKSVVTIDSMIPKMQDVLCENQRDIDSQLMKISERLRNRRSQLEKTLQQEATIQEEIKRVSQEAVDLIRQKEKKLLDELENMIEEQTGTLKGDIKSGEIDQQTYQHYSEFISDVLQSNSPIDLYDIYKVCQSGEIIGDNQRYPNGKETVKKISFKKDLDLKELDRSLQLGRLSIMDENFYQNCTPQMLSILDIEGDKMTPYPTDVTVLTVDGTDTLVVTDCKNHSVKFYYKKNGKTTCKPLKLKHQPRSVTKLSGDKVVISFLSHNSFVLVQVTSDPVHLSTITTQKKYKCLTALSDKTLAAGCKDPPSIDIVDLSGKVLRSLITAGTGKKLVHNPLFMCTTRQGHIVVSDWESESVYCVTQQGEVIFTHKLTGNWGGGCGGVTTTDTGLIFVVDYVGNKIIQLSETGRYVRDLLTSRGGIDGPQGICLHRNKLYVTEWNRNIKVFQLATS